MVVWIPGFYIPLLALPDAHLGSPRSRCWLIWFLIRTLFLTCRWWPFQCVLTRQWALVSLPLLMRAHQGSSSITASSNPNHLPKAPLLKPSHWGLGIQHRNHGGTDIQSLNIFIIKLLFLEHLPCVTVAVSGKYSYLPCFPDERRSWQVKPFTQDYTLRKRECAKRELHVTGFFLLLQHLWSESHSLSAQT